jgi:hypothetical protein
MELLFCLQNESMEKWCLGFYLFHLSNVWVLAGVVFGLNYNFPTCLIQQSLLIIQWASFCF